MSRDIPEIAYELTDISDTPLTIVYPEGRNLARGVCNEDGSVAIRICSDEFCSELITRFRKPLDLDISEYKRDAVSGIFHRNK